MTALGYRNRAYIDSLVDTSSVLSLEHSGGFLLQRRINSTDYSDATAPYPILSCVDWSGLKSDIDNMDDLISVVAVTDPMGCYDELLLQDTFVDVVQPFKQHYLTDLNESPGKIIHKHHQRNIRKAQGLCHVKIVQATDYLEQWVVLYAHLVKRHKITGTAVFSRRAFTQQLQMQDMRAMVALINDEIVGMVLWVLQDDIAYYHLGAYNDKGYVANAAFALFAYAIEYFSDQAGVNQLCLGGVAGHTDDENNGLARFKRGWSTHTRQSWLCGKVLQKEIYTRLSRHQSDTAFFPAYRG